MKKRISTRAICLLVAIIILAGALMVSAINGSPYENLKNAVFNALFYENVTIEGEITLRIDGQVHERAWMREYVGEESRFSLHGAESPWRQYGASLTIVNYETQGLRISPVVMPVFDEQWYRVSRNHRSGSNSIGYQMFGFNAIDRGSNRVRFVELLIDLLISDLKNNLTISSQGDGVRRVSGAITESQLPEIARVAIAVAIDEQLRWVGTGDNLSRDDFENIHNIPITGMVINRISGDADIDNDGNLLYINARAHVTVENIFGDSHEIKVEGYLRFSDIGTTVPESLFPCVEIFVELFESQDEWSWGWWSMYFTLDADGNIDLASIGSRPGNQEILAALDLLAREQDALNDMLDRLMQEHERVYERVLAESESDS